MRAVLRSIHSPDTPDLESWLPKDPDSFLLFVQALVGPSEGEGAESFNFEVCTPGWLMAECERRGLVTGRHRLIVARYDYTTVRRAIEGLVGNSEGRDWPEVAQQIARFGHWEFEDYRERPA